MKWIDINKEEPPVGIEVLFYNEKWIDEDLNPTGVIIGFKDDLMGYVSAKWSSCFDDYFSVCSTSENSYTTYCYTPTHWMYKPKFII